MEPIDISDLPIKLYGFCGKMGTGKDYIAKELFIPNISKEPTSILAFADHLKIDIASKHSLDLDNLYNKKNSESRKLLQQMGTEEGRNKYGEFVWINALGNWIKLLYQRGITQFIITDCRFINEINWVINNNGHIIYVFAPDRNYNRLLNESNKNIDILFELQNHISEIEQDQLSYDNIINNTLSNIDNVETDLKNIIIKIIT